jgi:hypothetical protein
MKLTRDTATPIPGTRFIDPEVLTRLSSVELVASTEFAEHRAYNPGDDIRRIDWRVYGRTDRLYVREFQAETNTNLTLVLDVSRSMGFRAGGVSKLDYGRFLAASLGYLSLQQRDRVGLITFDEDLVSVVPPSVKHFDRVLHLLDTATPARAGAFEKPLAFPTPRHTSSRTWKAACAGPSCTRRCANPMKTPSTRTWKHCAACSASTAWIIVSSIPRRRLTTRSSNI